MIRIRYRDSSEFSPGLHAAAERHGRTTTIYLLSGLTAPERGSALRRLRLSARMGHGPLPAVQLVFALLDDRIRTAVGRTGAVFRLHPAGSTVPVMVLSAGVIAFLLLSTVSIRVLPAPRTGPRSSVSGTSPLAPAGPIPIAGASQGQAPGLAGGRGDLGQGSDSRQLTKPRPRGSSPASPPSLAGPGGGQGTGTGTGNAATGTAATGSGTTSGTSSAGWTLSGPTPASVPTTASSTPAPAATEPQGAAAPPESAPSSATQGSGGLCVDVGPLGLCLNV